MIRSLSAKLTLAFLAVAFSGIAIVFLFSRYATIDRFDQMLNQKLVEQFASIAQQYYESMNTWDGIDKTFRFGNSIDPGLLQPQTSDNMLKTNIIPVYLTDPNGYILFPDPSEINKDPDYPKIPTSINMDTLETSGTPIEIDGKTVGYIIDRKQPVRRSPTEEMYISQINKSFLYAASGSSLIALLIAIFLAQTLTKPIRELTVATQKMANGELQQTVKVNSKDELGELASSFNQMSKDIARSNAARRQMTADIAHDLRTPLSVISGYIELLKDDVIEPDQEMMEIMYGETQHLNRLIEDLRTLSLADAGELSISPQSIAPITLLQRCGNAYRLAAEQNNIRITISNPEKTDNINVDPERMAQVFDNLIRNAFDHTPIGGEIQLCLEQNNKTVRFTVKDNGEGISSEDIPYIFDRFYRADKSRSLTEQKSASTGLGLAIAKSIVEMHAGTISVSSETGKGAIFTIDLPAIPGT